MHEFMGTVQDGQIVLSQPVDLPNGTKVLVEPVEDQDGSMSQEEIAQVLALMGQVEPLEMTDAELAAWEAARQEHKEWEKSRFIEHAEKLRKMWP